jgi:hypothetical protein
VRRPERLAARCLTAQICLIIPVVPNGRPIATCPVAWSLAAWMSCLTSYHKQPAANPPGCLTASSARERSTHITVNDDRIFALQPFLGAPACWGSLILFLIAFGSTTYVCRNDEPIFLLGMLRTDKRRDSDRPSLHHGHRYQRKSATCSPSDQSTRCSRWVHCPRAGLRTAPPRHRESRTLQKRQHCASDG